MEQILEGVRIVGKSRWGIVLGLLALGGLQGIIFFGPELLGSWAHDAFHGYRHAMGMPCH